MNPLIVWIVVVHWAFNGTTHPIEVYQTEGDCVSLGIYRREHTPHVTPKGGETLTCEKYKLEAMR